MTNEYKAMGAKIKIEKGAKTCLFCQSTLLFNIHEEFGNTNHTIKSDLIKVLGSEIEEHLRPDDAVCTMCMHFMDNIAKIKCTMRLMVMRENGNVYKLPRLGAIFKMIATIDLTNDPCFITSPNPSPNELMEVMRTSPYMASTETSLSYIRSTSVASGPDSEISAAFSQSGGKRRRRKGHRWTHRKRSKYNNSTLSLETGMYPRRRRRSRSNNSRATSIGTRGVSMPELDQMEDVDLEDEFRHRNDESSTSQVLRYDMSGCLLNKRTRSVSKLQEFLNDGSLYCVEPDCFYNTNDQELLNEHKMEEHRIMPLYICEICNTKFFTKPELASHEKEHIPQTEIRCFICGHLSFSKYEYESHWRYHLRKAIECRHCGKRFLTRAFRDKHKLKEHEDGGENSVRVDYLEKRDGNSNLGFSSIQLLQNDMIEIREPPISTISNANPVS